MKFWHLLLLLLSFSGFSQEVHFAANDFAQQVLRYEPVQRGGVDKVDFERGKFYLEETRRQTKRDEKNFNVADYWNVTIAFIRLQEPPAHIELAFQMAIEADAEAVCSYINSFGGKHAGLNATIPTSFQKFLATCGNSGECGQTLLSPAEYADKYGFSEELISLIEEIRESDQRYRFGHQFPKSQQQELDRRNQQRIETLFTKYGTYVGRSLVGEEYESVMWQVVQHSSPEMMQRYLPIIAAATETGEISHDTPLRMLLDRIHALETGTQFFGSQQNVELTGEEERQAILKRYPVLMSE